MAVDPDQIYKALRPVPEFDGNPNILTRFIRICDQIVTQYIRTDPGNELNNLSLINGILNKITGPAARTINSNGIPENWLGIRTALINNFSDQRDETALYNDLSLLTLANNNDQINGQPLKITEIPKDAKITGPIRPHIKLTSLNLEKIHQIQDDIIQQHPVDLEQSDVTNQALFHRTIPFYGALCGAIVLAVVIAVHRHKSCNITLEKKPREETSKFHPYESPEEPQKKDRIPVWRVAI
ncbi:uncharacterized protein LOC114252443, partial [Bombyx mandarina]|uniref:Uncharacterized protein LOC114252443 n=1 Tax=Bombyx mandarina TaxID=7092 RepID=A0A6J2KK56_BOMMA